MKICKVKDCDKKTCSLGYCPRHYRQLRINGKILKRTRYDKNKIVCNDKYCEIFLYNRKQKVVGKAKIDIEDYEKTKKYKWCYCGGYAMNKFVGRLHHFLIGKPPEGLVTDHINRDKIDNRKKNLRFCTQAENAQNKKVKGIYFDKTNRKWCAEIMAFKKYTFLGRYKTEKEALEARRKGEEKYFNLPTSNLD